MIIKTKISQINKAVRKLVQAEINLCNSVKIPFLVMPKKNSAKSAYKKNRGIF